MSANTSSMETVIDTVITFLDDAVEENTTVEKEYSNRILPNPITKNHVLVGIRSLKALDSIIKNTRNAQQVTVVKKGNQLEFSLGIKIYTPSNTDGSAAITVGGGLLDALLFSQSFPYSVVGAEWKPLTFDRDCRGFVQEILLTLWLYKEE